MAIANQLHRFLSKVQTGIRPFLPVLALILYTVAGALTFMWLEKPNEESNLSKLKAERENLLEVRNFLLFKSATIFSRPSSARVGAAKYVKMVHG